jgi:hypothetical protein
VAIRGNDTSGFPSAFRAEESRRLEELLASPKQFDFDRVFVQPGHACQFLERMALHFPQHHQSASLFRDFREQFRCQVALQELTFHWWGWIYTLAGFCPQGFLA